MKKTITFLMLLGTLIAAWAADATFFGGQGSEPTAQVAKTSENEPIVMEMTYGNLHGNYVQDLDGNGIWVYFYDEVVSGQTYTLDDVSQILVALNYQDFYYVESFTFVYNRTDEGMSVVANFELNGVAYQFNYSHTFQTHNEVAYVFANSLQSENIGLDFWDNDWNAFDMTAVGTYTAGEDIIVSSGFGLESGTLVIAQNQDGQYTYTFTGVADNGDQWTLTAVSGTLPAVTDTVDVVLSNVEMYDYGGEYEFRLEQGEGDDYIYFDIEYFSESVVSDINSENLYGAELSLGDQYSYIYTTNGTVTAIENGYHFEAYLYTVSGTVYHVTFDWTLSADVVTVTSDQMRFFEQWGERLYIVEEDDLAYVFRVDSNEDGEDVIAYAYIRDFNAGYGYDINVTSQSITIGENNLAHVMVEGYTVVGQRYSFDLQQRPAQRIDLTFDEVEHHAYYDEYEASDGEHIVAVSVYGVGELGPDDFWMRYNGDGLSTIRATVTPMGSGAIIDAWGLYQGDTLHVVMNYNLPTNVNEFVSNNVTLDGNTMTATSAEGYSVYFYTWYSLQDDMSLQMADGYSQMEVSLAMNNNEISLSEAMANISHDEISTICDLWMHDVDGAWYHTVMTYTPHVDTTNIVATDFEMDEERYPGYTFWGLQAQNGDIFMGLIPGAAADIQSGLTYNIEEGSYSANIDHQYVTFSQVNFTLTRSEEGYVTVIVKAFDYGQNLHRWIYSNVPVVAKDTIELQFDSTFRNGNMYAGFDYMIDEEVGIPHNAMAIEYYNNGGVNQQNSMIIYNGTPIQVMDANVTNVLETDSVIVLDAYLMGTDTVMYHSVMTFQMPVENFVGSNAYVHFWPATDNGTGIDLWDVIVIRGEEYFYFDIIADSVVPGHTYTLEDMYFSETGYANYNTYQWIDYRTAQMTLTYDEEGLMHIDANVTLVNSDRYHVVYNQLSPSAAKDTVELVFDNAQFYNRIEENGTIYFGSEDENDYVRLYTNTVEGSYNEYDVHTFNVSNTANRFLSFNATVSAVGEGWLLDCYAYGADTVMYHIVMKYNITEALYTVTAQSSDNAMGTVTGAGMFVEGTTATLVATANAHHHFVNWSNGDTTATITVVVNSDTTFIANFAIDQHNVAVAANDTVMGTVTGAGVYNYGATATLVATANAHYHFVNWSNGDTTATINVTVNDDMNLTANFAIDQHNVTVAANDTVMGTVTGAGEYNYGATATLVATAKAHYHFVNWSNGDTTATISVTVNGDMNLTANFAIDQHNVTVAANDTIMGTVTGAGAYNYGATATLVATANAHYHFVNWSNGDTTATISVTVNGDTTFTANFAIDQYNVIATANDTVMGTVTGAGVYTYGDTATLVATANEGYHFVRWSNGDTAATITIVVDENMELEAIFEQNQTQGIDNVDASEIVVSVSNCSISVSGANNQMLYIFDVNGRMIVRESAVDHKQYRMPSTGVYLVKVGNRPAQKVVVVR